MKLQLSSTVRNSLALWGVVALVASPSPLPAQDTNPPAAPQNVRAIELSPTTALVSWSPATDNVGVTGYQVFRDSVFLAASAITNFTDAGPLDPYRSYEYTVAAFDAAGNTSAPSSVVVFAYHRFPFAMPWDDTWRNSVTDLSPWSSVPADTFITAANGHLAAGAQPIRFLGVNCVFNAAFPPHDVAEKVAARLARLGVNCVRFHHMDTQSSPSGIFVNVSSSNPGYRRALDPVQVERLDYFIAQLKRRGIYANLNLHVGRNYPGFPTNGASSYFKGLDNYMPGMIDLQKEYARDLLAHVNPYTGRAYTDEPAVAFIEINNENGLIGEWHGGLFGPDLHTNYLNELTAQWNTWLAARYTNTPALAAAWAASPGTPYGRELLTNGTFAAGATAPWQLLVSSPAAATALVLTNATPNGTNALEINVTATSTNADALRLVQSGFALAQGQPCTISFWAQAETPRAAPVRFAPTQSPSTPLAETSVILATNWEQHTIVLVPANNAINAQFSLGGLALAPGRVRVANFSVKTGNTLLGPSSAWAEGGSALEMLTNGSFAAGFVSPWSLQVVAPAAAVRTLLTNGAPDGSTALEINVTTNDTSTWHVQFYQTGLRLTNGQAYTVRFAARSEEARSVSVGIMQSGSPWAGLGSGSVTLATNWQDFTVVLTAGADESNARLNIGELASNTGRVWFASMSVKASVPGLGLLPEEALGSVNIVRKDQFKLRTRAVQRDWMQFLWDTERAYWNGMSDYIKGTLGAKALVIGTQTSYSPDLIQADLDVVDSHSYWQHPYFPHVAWDRDDWTVQNKPMTGVSSGSTIPGRAHTRVAGKPFICTEYNHPAPITYATEMMPLLAAYAALQDWDAVFAYDFLGSTNLNQEHFSGFFDVAREPGKLVTFPVAAAMLRRGDVAAAPNESRATVTTDMAITKVGLTDASIGASDFGVDGLLAFRQSLAMAAGPVAQVHAAIRAANQPVFASDTGQLNWDTANGLLTIRAPRVKAVIGHANQRTFDLGDGVVVTPGATMQGTNWAALTLFVTDGAGFQSANSRVLITAVGYVDNHRMLWKPGMGPTNSPASVGTNWGKAPTLMESVPATITLPSPAGQVRVWALDGRGDRKTAVPVTDAAGRASFTIGREFESPWYEVAIACQVPPAVQFTSPTDGVLLDNASAITLTVAATGLDYPVSKVEFFNGAAKLGEAAAAPYTLTLPANFPLGPCTFTAVVTDTAGQTGTNAVSVQIVRMLPLTISSAGAVWRYLDNAVDQGTAWRSNTFSDAGWRSGRAMLGFGDANGQWPVTTIASNRQWTAYFRREFYLPSAAQVQSLTVRLLRDDGAVVYLNGVEVWRNNMPSGTILYSTPASSNVTGADENRWYTQAIATAPLRDGTNLLAVEVHQQNTTSSDLSFDFELTGTAVIAAPPELGWSASNHSLSLAWPADPGFFTLYATTNLAPPILWSRVTNTSVLSNSQWMTTLPVTTNGQRFYRLQSP